ncbi:uncharacterized protein MELLADRAFT_86127 [Melampsora larici-populina 98AG31]|uniref:Uncharacterized protein n=1 Tax=Melampsora larici-populina (strain 98AG31 / pathotype 3-4-7) TaxID=747676 RepID=F4RLD8_MELLP|nr:uncharacterized protein MELLADRAFT_86127 [Melampsora larici-populina 98AG31]EGG07015.1 hypothetical protein MELLADRAFT_86127 [Melampsora larici-populina 98AG31]
MNCCIDVVGQNRTGRSMLSNWTQGKLMSCDGFVRKHTGLKVARRRQHSAYRLPYDKGPIG